MDNYVGQDIGIYHIEFLCDHRDNDGHKLYHAKCKYCGYESDMRLSNIKHATICKHKNRVGNFIDFRSSWKNNRLNMIFKNMQDRCLNPNCKDYRWYGAKGIGIYQQWLDAPKSFEEWALNNGYADGLTIDRIESDKDYCPDNCRWITLEENSRRAGKVNWITVNGETLTGKQWAEKLGIGINIINTAIRKNGLELTIELIKAMLKDPPNKKQRKPHDAWFSIYGIHT